MFTVIYLVLYFNIITEITGQEGVCSHSPCENAGICRPTGTDALGNETSYRCTCRPYFTGEHCQIPVVNQNACFSFPCQYGGTCFGSSSTYRCECISPWTGLRCQIGRCPDPGTPNNGIRHGNEVTFGSKIAYSCQDGYRLIGASQLLCLVNQTWSYSVPHCQWIDEVIEPATKDPLTLLPIADDGSLCPDPGQPSNGYRIGDLFKPGSSVSFKCDDGYTLTGYTPLYCLATGTWHQNVPICQETSTQCFGSGSVAAAAIVPILIFIALFIISMFVFNRYRVKTRWLRAVRRHGHHDQTSRPRISSISEFSFSRQIGVNNSENPHHTIAKSSDDQL